MAASEDGGKHADIRGMAFEAAIEELEGIVERLESGDAALQESIDLYDRGASLRAHCEAKLKEARERVEQVVGGSLEPMAGQDGFGDDDGEDSPF